MIFSLRKGPEYSSVQFAETHCYCLFNVKDSIYLPEESLKTALLASLKSKMNVLILERPLDIKPINSTQRWVVGDGFIWLVPRAHSHVFEAFLGKPMIFSSLRDFLSTSK